MNPLAIWALFKKVYVVVKIGKVLWNSPKIYRFLKQFGGVAESVIKEHRLPKNEEAQAFLRATAELMRAQIVDFPNVDEDVIAEKLEYLAAELEAA